ncbi:hypothetical protein F53441_8310 [Fusarium austroafricanum]|uniref:Uncharacterized protein n=1 Tax=Fusarium austroafricanum TaxID=2364996 RepID=A0A8H4NXH7_9HYPO|nr:hypothetical protein F53441_8310 [Fusarium austroafricanum]
MEQTSFIHGDAYSVPSYNSAYLLGLWMSMPNFPLSQVMDGLEAGAGLPHSVVQRIMDYAPLQTDFSLLQSQLPSPCSDEGSYGAELKAITAGITGAMEPLEAGAGLPHSVVQSIMDYAPLQTDFSLLQSQLPSPCSDEGSYGAELKAITAGITGAMEPQCAVSGPAENLHTYINFASTTTTVSEGTSAPGCTDEELPALTGTSTDGTLMQPSTPSELPALSPQAVVTHLANTTAPLIESSLPTEIGTPAFGSPGCAGEELPAFPDASIDRHSVQPSTSPEVPVLSSQAEEISTASGSKTRIVIDLTGDDDLHALPQTCLGKRARTTTSGEPDYDGDWTQGTKRQGRAERGHIDEQASQAEARKKLRSSAEPKLEGTTIRLEIKRISVEAVAGKEPQESWSPDEFAQHTLCSDGTSVKLPFFKTNEIQAMKFSVNNGNFADIWLHKVEQDDTQWEGHDGFGVYKVSLSEEDIEGFLIWPREKRLKEYEYHPDM